MAITQVVNENMCFFVIWVNLLFEFARSFAGVLWLSLAFAFSLAHVMMVIVLTQ